MTRLATLNRSFPTFRLIVAPFRWIGRSRRRLWVASLILLAMIATPPLWWATQLLGLPDIGEPFDVKAFQAFTIPDDRNAFVPYSRAAAVIKPIADVLERTPQVELFARWSSADPELRRCVEENRAALDLYHLGAEMPDALDPAVGSSLEDWKTFNALRSLQFLALLEGSRLEKKGDMAGAWGWYRASLRTIHHAGLRGPAIRRLIAQTWHRDVSRRMATWAADPRTTPALLRRALEDVVACERLAPSETDTLKFEYLFMERMIDNPNGPVPRTPAWFVSMASRPSGRRVLSVLTTFLTPEHMGSAFDAWRAWRREAERSRRVLRLVMANWLEYYARPPRDRPKPGLDLPSSFDFYAFGSESPARAHVLSPESLSRWLDSTHDTEFLLRRVELSRIRVNEWANHRNLLILLGTQLYHRDHGTDPPTPEALVGPYLERLPPELPDGEMDESIPKFGKPAN